ncbi:hypothetical protein [Streptomyces sp. NPDC059761]|uniref:hypothetical protein n=1 Tax=Streptomyces sp. NPDC059761 TaxID=3346937 RepID=UPI00366782A5
MFIETPASRYTWDGVDAQGYRLYFNGVRNAAVGDYICRLGYTSKVVCNIRTAYAGSATWVNDGAYVWGSASAPDNNSTVARPGDSGGRVTCAVLRLQTAGPPDHVEVLAFELLPARRWSTRPPRSATRRQATLAGTQPG